MSIGNKHIKMQTQKQRPKLALLSAALRYARCQIPKTHGHGHTVLQAQLPKCSQKELKAIEKQLKATEKQSNCTPTLSKAVRSNRKAIKHTHHNSSQKQSTATGDLFLFVVNVHSKTTQNHPKRTF